MIIGFNIAATALTAIQESLVINTSNISNAMTGAYKTRRAELENNFPFLLSDAMTDTIDEGFDAKGRKKRVYEIGTGVRIADVSMDMTQGKLDQTNREYDMAINGLGFFKLKQPTGETVYARSGVFKRDKKGYIVDLFGNRLDPAVRVPDTVKSVQVGMDGRIAVVYPGNDSQPRYIGQIRLAVFDNPENLQALGNNVYAQTESAGQLHMVYPNQKQAGDVMQGFVESSNVNIVDQMMKLVLNQRNFKISTKAFLVSDAIMKSGM